MPLEGSSNSGTYFPSFIEKARNIKTDGRAASGDKNPNALADAKKVEIIDDYEDDDYINDDFEAASGTGTEIDESKSHNKIPSGVGLGVNKS